MLLGIVFVDQGVILSALIHKAGSRIRLVAVKIKIKEADGFDLVHFCIENYSTAIKLFVKGLKTIVLFS